MDEMSADVWMRQSRLRLMSCVACMDEIEGRLGLMMFTDVWMR